MRKEGIIDIRTEERTPAKRQCSSSRRHGFLRPRQNIGGRRALKGKRRKVYTSMGSPVKTLFLSPITTPGRVISSPVEALRSYSTAEKLLHIITGRLSNKFNLKMYQKTTLETTAVPLWYRIFKSTRTLDMALLRTVALYLYPCPLFKKRHGFCALEPLCQVADGDSPVCVEGGQQCLGEYGMSPWLLRCVAIKTKDSIDGNEAYRMPSPCFEKLEHIGGILEDVAL